MGSNDANDSEDMTADTLGNMSHTNPYTGRVFGDTQTYSRGRTIAADGGTADSAPEAETLKDIDHKPDDEVDGAQGTFDRGEEAPDGTDDE